MRKALNHESREVNLPAFFILVILLSFGCQKSVDTHLQNEDFLAGKAASKAELPELPGTPAGFVDGISNPYLAFAPGRVFRYQGQTDEGLETVVVEVTNKHKTILGVRTTVIHDQAFLDGELIEDTYDWMAQDQAGNVWYFGEDSKEMEDGEVISTEGSWEAGINGALPGILMLAQPKVGTKYQQEFAEDVAEDMAKVLSLTETVTIGLGTFTNCLETMEWTPLEPGAREHKYYQPGMGLLLESGHRGAGLELVAIED